MNYISCNHLIALTPSSHWLFPYELTTYSDIQYINIKIIIEEYSIK